ncbi:hypothetical protein LX32DRAFT_642083 [Colletotrichum zoysiae]|uniref:Uncharacterized protein n=1 Tax=Colletotrichum zoysiae TaxID=1216348 RepID=A0AAD9HD80_9PEZI|nr:hypothetical protein LX32DRAFT_642083 [Colletotrichum zoysiae]
MVCQTMPSKRDMNSLRKSRKRRYVHHALVANMRLVIDSSISQRHAANASSKPSMGSQQKKGVNLEGMQPGKQTGQEKAGKKT